MVLKRTFLGDEDYTKARFCETLDEYKKTQQKRFKRFKDIYKDAEYTDFLKDDHAYFQALKGIGLEAVESADEENVMSLKFRPTGFDFINLNEKGNPVLKLEQLKLSFNKILEHIENQLNTYGWYYEPNPMSGSVFYWVKRESADSDIPIAEFNSIGEKLHLLLQTGVIEYLIQKYSLKKEDGTTNANKLAEMLHYITGANKKSIQPILNVTLNDPDRHDYKNLNFNLKAEAKSKEILSNFPIRQK